MSGAIDPLRLRDLLWPGVRFSREQRDIIYSVQENRETVVVAANMMGKDFVAAFIAVEFMLSRQPVRVVTTSVSEYQLDEVLWGEIRRFILTANPSLDSTQGGPLLCNAREIRKMIDGAVDPISYMIAKVAKKGEGMSGHHVAEVGDGVPRTLFIGDEASGIDQETIQKARGWASRVLLIGNPWDCENDFRKGAQGGDLPNDNPRMGAKYLRKVFTMAAERSPNVRLAMAEKSVGREPSGRQLIPGILSYDEYCTRRQTWDDWSQCVGLDARWYEGPELRMYPAAWLDKAAEVARSLNGTPRRARAVGIDTGEGVANTAWAIVDDRGLIKLVSMKTPDTSVITGMTLGLMREYGLSPENILFDAGGGGREHADRLRAQGFQVRTVAFGESVTPDPRRGVTPLARRTLEKEERYVYKNRRAEMYHLLRQRLDPAAGQPFGIAAEHEELRRQMQAMPLQYDGEGRIVMPPKNRVGDGTGKKTLMDILGSSPDETDALVLAVYGLVHKPLVRTAGALR